MHPAFSVIFFTTASGAGFGLFAWFGLLAWLDALPGRAASAAILVAGALLVVAGLLSSTAHLGKPLRSWRAFSQWRSSWLSREGVLSVSCLLAGLVAGALVLWAQLGVVRQSKFLMPLPPVIAGSALQWTGALVGVLSLASVACTAMIYASLKPIPAWTHRSVVPTYLGFSLFTGYLALITLVGWFDVTSGAGLLLAWLAAPALLVLKASAWWAIDHPAPGPGRNAALGLPPERRVTVFERPHTEENYLLREMGYVVARKHGRRLRIIASLLFAAVPMACVIPVSSVSDSAVGPWAAVAAVSALLGTLVERWLFFAEAKHLVTLYY